MSSVKGKENIKTEGSISLPNENFLDKDTREKSETVSFFFFSLCLTTI
jgi:hypothetical protein